MTNSTYPFITPQFLDALEQSQSADAASGWQPIHIKLDDEDKTWFMPLYLKNHSMGEYVFDYAWANAYHQHGMDYYPKLVTAVPFTPSTGERLRGSTGLRCEHARQILDQIEFIADETAASSWHLLFPNDEQRSVFNDQRLLTREGVQYHWFNKDYKDFEDYLAAMTSRKRKMINKERARVRAQNINIKILQGSEIDVDIWTLFYQLYERTYAKRNGTRGYLTNTFFNLISRDLHEQIAMAVAYINGQPIACALYLFDHSTLYGRYWGSVDEFQYLHFELCYYSGIEFAIELGLQRYDAGAQGEHKLVRGFEPVQTYSLHWIKDEQFRDAIRRFTTSEKQAVRNHIEQAKTLLPFKQQ